MNQRFFPVIHVRDTEQACRNAQVAQRAGVDGVFLIHHKKSYRHLLTTAELIHRDFPNLWIGLNMLDVPANYTFAKVPRWVNAIWTDNAGIWEGGEDGSIFCEEAAQAVEQRALSGWMGEYFGGFAFKYQKPIVNLEEVARIASFFMDTVTTSGDGTGIAADVEKIKRIALSVHSRTNARVGIASGITPENVQDYLPYVDDFLVATGISKNDYELDPEKVALLRSKIVK